MVLVGPLMGSVGPQEDPLPSLWTHQSRWPWLWGLRYTAPPVTALY